MRKFIKRDVKTIRFEADAYLRNSIGQTMVLEKVKSLNYKEESLAEGQKIYDEDDEIDDEKEDDGNEKVPG